MASGGTATLSLRGTVQPGWDGRPVTNFAAVTACDQADAVTGNNSDTAILTPEIDLTPGTVQFWPGANESSHQWPGAADPVPVLALTLTNQGDADDTLDSLVLTNLTDGDGTQAQLDAEWQPVSLQYSRRGSGSGVSAPLSRPFIGGQAAFSGLGWSLAPGDTLDIRFLGAPSVAARDMAVLQAGLESPGDVGVDQAVSSPGSWPLIDGSQIRVDGFVAAQAAIVPVPSALFPVGSLDNLALAVDLPGNGYLDDTLYGIAVANRGNALPGDDIAALNAWLDDGDGTFDPDGDTSLGTLVHSGELWQISGLDAAMPASGRRIFVTVDLAETANPARDIRLSLPAGHGPAVQMFSGNDGPVDRDLENPHSQGVSVTDRIIVTADWVHSTPVYPGTRDLTLLQFALTNTYDSAQVLESLRVTNNTDGLHSHSQSELDDVFRQVVLRFDGNGNGVLDEVAIDDELASGIFTDGVAAFSGLGLRLEPGSSALLFVTADLSLTKAADGDYISAMVQTSADVEIPGAVLVGNWPLDSGATWTVDGMVADQIATAPVTVLTLGPSEGPVLALDLTVPSNGHHPDELTGITFTNHGSAEAGDLARAQLWTDGGDGNFGGDDSLLGPLTISGSSWSSTVLSRAIDVDGLRLFVSLDVADTPRDSVTVQLGLPIGGITVSSGNDGPLDRSLAETGTLVISTSPLRSTVSFARPGSNVGQTGTVSMTVLNAGSEIVTGVDPQLGLSSGDGTLTLGAPVPATITSLNPGDETIVTWTFTATGAGEVVLAGNAEGLVNDSQVRRSIQTPTSAHAITIPVDRLELFPTLNLPFSVNRGQTGLVPLTLTFMNPGDVLTANAQLTALKIRLLETAAGPGIVPADLLSRVIVSEGTEIYLDLTDPPTSGDEVDLVLSRPVTITSSEPVTLGLRLDLTSASGVPSFLIEITEATWLSGNDAVDFDDIPVQLSEGTFPLRTGQATLVSPASGLSIAVSDQNDGYAAPGQQDVLVAELELSNTSAETNSSTIEMGRLAFVFLDGNGVPVADPGTRLERVRLISPFQTHFDGPLPQASDSLAVLQFNTPVIVPANSTLSLQLVADVAAGTPLGELVPVLGGTAQIDARDGNMNNQVPVIMTTEPTAPQLIILGPATEITVGGEGLLPNRISLGTWNLPAMSVALLNSHDEDCSPIVCDTLRVTFMDGNRQALDPERYLTRIRVMQGDVTLGSAIDPAAGDGVIPIPVSGIVLEPQASAAVQIEIDVAPDAPTGHIELAIPGDGLRSHDQITGLPVAPVTLAGDDVFLSSGASKIIVPADELQIGFTSLIPALMVPGSLAYPVMKLELTNPAPPGGGSLVVTSLTFTQIGDGMDDHLLGQLVNGVQITTEQKIIAGTAEISPDASEVTSTLR